MGERKRRSKEINSEIDNIDMGGELKLGPFVEDDYEKDRMKRHAQKRRMKIITTVLEIAGGIIALALILFLVMRIRVMNFNGLTLMTPEEMKGMTGVAQNESFFSIRRDRIKANIEADPHFLVDEIKYRFPSNLDVTIRERYNEACIAAGDVYVYFDREGTVLEVLDKAEGAKAPVVDGIEFSEYEVGQSLVSDEKTKFNSLKELLSEIVTTKTFGQIVRIDMSDINRLTMYLESGTKVFLGQNHELHEKIAWLDSIVETITKEGYRKGEINLSSAVMPVYTPEGAGDGDKDDQQDPGTGSDDTADDQNDGTDSDAQKDDKDTTDTGDNEKDAADAGDNEKDTEGN
ncbi:MAG: cell division protein FtsQ/DivIB [Clostridia bacterium]|nr:cell division protein FtsQ/DivIB [Clostridia bacterium]